MLAPEINEATVRLLTRHGCEVVVAAGAGCCGALTHHLGQDARAFARANILAWTGEIARGGLDAIVVNASGCGTTIKDYGFMFRNDPELAAPAAAVAALARDVTELMAELGLRSPSNPTGRRVAYHSACSLQHGQRVRAEPKALLEAAGFVVIEPPEGHLCCGSAGTYNLLQPELATRLRDRKVAAIDSVSPDLVAAGNIGCLTQIASGTRLPVVHTVELLDWATGGPRPQRHTRLTPGAPVRHAFSARSAPVRTRSARLQHAFGMRSAPENAPLSNRVSSLSKDLQPSSGKKSRAAVAVARRRRRIGAGGRRGALGPSRSDYDRIRFLANICRSHFHREKTGRRWSCGRSAG